jgi:hypothetical protein
MRRVLLFLLLVFLPATAHAQQADSVRQLFDRAHRGNWYLRVRLLDSTLVEGRVPRLSATAATVTRTVVPFDQVSVLERRFRVGGGGKQVGIATGLLTGAFITALYTGLCEGDCGSGGAIGAAVGGFGTGFALGAFFGSVVNPGRIEWRPVWPPAAATAFAAQPDSAPRVWSPRVTTAYVGGAFERGDVPPLIPYLYGLQFAAQRGDLEVTFLDIFATWDGPASGLDAVAGGNWHITQTNYLGVAVGAGNLTDHPRALAVARIGVHKPERQGFRLELRAISTVRDPRVVGYLVLGYDVRRRS